MSIIKKFIFIIFITLFVIKLMLKKLKKMGTHKDWETYVINSDTGKVCFAQSKPVLQAPKTSLEKQDYLLVLDPDEKIKDEISITAGYEFNKKNLLKSISGKNKYKFDIAQEGFAWMADTKQEKKMIKTMKKDLEL